MKKSDDQKTSKTFVGGAVRSYIALALIYYLLVIFLPANRISMQALSLSPNQYHALLFLVTLPYAAIWLAAFYGYGKLQDYASKLDGTPEGIGFRGLARGCKWLAWGLPLPSIIGLILNSIASRHPGLHSTAIILANYLNLVFSVIGFTIISSNAHELVTITREKLTVGMAKSLQFVFVTLGVFYCYLVFRHLDLHSLSSTNNPYYLPVWLMVLTIIIPYLYAWFIGLLAAYDLSLLAKHSSGVLYRRALTLVASGIVLVVASLISVQYLRSVVPRTGHLSLNTTLVTTYIFYGCTILGFALLAIGAHRLKRIEEV